ncbi:apolipoprotein N-acyltransferase [Dermabacteraceae bacterium P13138]
MSRAENAREAREAARRPRCPLLLSLPLAVLAGYLLYASFPALGLWWCYPLGVAALTLSLLGRGNLLAALNGLVAGGTFFGLLIGWAGTYTGSVLPWLALTLSQAVFFAGYAVAAALLLRRRGLNRFTPFALALLWTGCEYLRANYPYGGFPWGSAGFSQADSPLAAAAPYIGMAGFALLLALLGNLLASALARRSAPPLLLAIALALAASYAPQLPVEKATLRVVAIQGNIPEESNGFGLYHGQFLDNHVDTTRRWLRQAKPAPDMNTLVVWPENASDIDLDASPRAHAKVQAVVDEVGSPVLVGVPHYVQNDRYRYNELQYWLPGRGAVDVYRKQKPVPFGEYVPDRAFFEKISALIEQVGTDMLPGKKPAHFTSARPDVGALICFEIAYESLVQQSVLSGAQVIVVPTNNGSFGRSDQSVQQLAMSRIFARIAHRSFVHASTVGESGVYGPDGRELGRLGHYRSGWIDTTVPLSQVITPAVQAGSYPYLVSLGGAGLVLLYALTGRAGRSGRKNREDT